MTDLQDRLTRLADAAVADRPLVDPSSGVGSPPSGSSSARRSRPPWPWLGAAAAVLVLLLAVAAVVVRSDGDDPVTAGAAAPAPGSGAGAVLAVPFSDVVSRGVPPRDLVVTVRDEAGAVVVRRDTAEIERPVGDGSGDVFVDAAIVADLPDVGTYTVVAEGRPGSVACSTGPVAAGDRVILPLLTEDGPPACGTVQSVEEWAEPSGEEGQAYVGLTEADAEAVARADGRTARVTARDGANLFVTADLDPTRVDLTIFDGVVVSAALGGEPRVVAPVDTDVPTASEPLAVVFVTRDGRLDRIPQVGVVPERGDGVLDAASEPDDGTGGASLLVSVPPGSIELTIGEVVCAPDPEVADEGTIVTVEVAADGTPVTDGCDATVQSLAEHVALVTEGWEQHEPADGYVGLTEDEAESRAATEGHEVRVLARDGVVSGQDHDLRPDRVNLVVYDDEVRAAALF